MTVRENLEFPLVRNLKHLSKKEVETDIDDVLDAVFSAGTGFSIMAAIRPAAGDLGAVYHCILSKWGVAVAALDFAVFNSVIRFVAAYGALAATRDDYDGSTTLVAGTRYVVTVTFDPSLARSRASYSHNLSPLRSLVRMS